MRLRIIIFFTFANNKLPFAPSRVESWVELRPWKSGSFHLCQRRRVRQDERFEKGGGMLHNTLIIITKAIFFLNINLAFNSYFLLMAVWLVKRGREREAEDEWWCFIFIKLSQVTILTFLWSVQVHCQSVHFHKKIIKSRLHPQGYWS